MSLKYQDNRAFWILCFIDHIVLLSALFGPLMTHYQVIKPTLTAHSANYQARIQVSAAATLPLIRNQTLLSDSLLS